MNEQLLQSFREKLAEPVTKENYQHVLAGLVEQLRAERGCMWLERENRFLYEGDEGLRKEFPFSRQAVDAVLEQGRSFLSFDPEHDPRISEDSSLSLNVRCCLAASCTDQNGNVLALAYFDNDMKKDQFSHRDLRFLKAVLSLVPGALKVE